MHAKSYWQRLKLGAIAALMVVGNAVEQSAFAYWIDTKTGQRVADWPSVGGDVARGIAPHVVRGSDPNRVYDPETGRNFARDECGNWIDTKTGKRVASWPSVGGDVARGIAPHVVRGSDPNRVYDPETGRNFARVPCPPRTAVAPPPTPQVGMVVEPHIGIGGGGASGTATYRSTGAQAPFDGDWSKSNVQVCGGATFWPGFMVGPVNTGLDINVCSGTNAFGGDTTLFRILRHGATGDVDLKASSNVIIDLLFKGEMPVGPTNNLFLSVGIGPTFRQLDLTITSNQVPGGGTLVSNSQSSWQTGLAVGGGLSTFVCPDCIGGNPLKIGVDGRVRFFPSQSVSVPSAVFPFTETGSTGSTTDYSVMATFSAPFTMSDVRAKRDIVALARLDNGVGLYRYRYVWSDQLYVGVMAQEVAKAVPAAVVLGADGYLRVDYSRLRLRLQTWDEWMREHSHAQATQLQ